MAWTLAAYYIPFYFSVILSFGLAVILWKRQIEYWGKNLAQLMLAVGLWNASYLWELSTLSLEARWLFVILQHLIAATVPLIWFTLAHRLNRHASFLDSPVSIVLFIIPFITLVLMGTPQWHSLFISISGVSQVGPVVVMYRTYGVWFWLQLFYSCSLVLYGDVVLLKNTFRTSAYGRAQKAALAAAAGLPWLAGLLYLVGIDPLPGVNVTPIFFTLSGLALYWALFGPGMKELMPIARGMIFDQMPDLALVVNPRLQIVDLNPALRRLVGQRADHLVGRSLYEAFPWAEPLIRRCQGAARVQEEIMIRQRWYELSVHPLIVKSSEQGGWLILLRDLHDHKTAELELLRLKDNLEERVEQRTRELRESETALRESQAQLEAIFDNVAAGICLLDLQGRFVRFNQTWASMLGYTQAELTHRSSRDVVFDGQAVFDRDWFMLRTGGKTQPYRCEERFVCQDGKPFWGELSVTPVLGAGGELESLLCVVFNVSDRKRYEQQIIHNAMHDSLTGLPNRDLFLDRLGQALQRSQLYGENNYAVLYLDYDHFKDINDSLGHNFGDHLLIQSAARLKKLFQPTDTFARMGGDEFVVLLDEGLGKGRAAEMAASILEQMQTPFLLDGRYVVISASIGILKNLNGYQKPDDVLRDADIAMYRAKLLGRNRFEEFDSVMRARVVARLEQEIGLRRALEHGELLLDYQPVVSFQTGQVTGFEALVRWLSPEHGLVFPGEFIPLAEETGLIFPIGQWVLEEACRTMAAWQAQYPCDPPLTIGVNLSPRQFNSPDLLEQVAGVLTSTGLPAQSLRIEITESVLLEDLEATERLLTGLRSMGVQTMIDDFGTGYSSLSYLHRFSIGALKIDRAFIARLDTADQGQNGTEIVRAILAMAREMGLKVVAEGIESQQQMAVLRALNCDYGQGYLIARPIPKEGVALFMRDQKNARHNRPTLPAVRKSVSCSN